MAQHRKRPVSRHQWRIPGRRARHAEPRQRHVAGAARRVVVTPTFAAGLGVVVAAVLAYQMGAPSFRVSMPRWNGQRCATVGCAPVPARSGPAAVKSGQRLRASPPPAAAGTGAVRRARPGGGAVAPAVTYQTTGSWPGGFQGMLTVTVSRAYPPGRWWLRFGYPSGDIERVWGTVRVRRQGKHVAVVAAPTGWRPGEGLKISVLFQVAGQAGRPVQCFFDRVPCRIR